METARPPEMFYLQPPFDDTRVILTDYFDTLASRLIAPEDVKRLWACQLANLLRLPLDGDQLYSRRAQIEADLCIANERRGMDRELDIYSCYAALWNSSVAPEIAQDRFIELAAETELAIECSVQRIDNNVANYLRYWRSHGLDIYLISDFYFPSPLFRRLLVHHNIADIFTEIRVSADDLCTKRSGKRFKKLLSELPCAPAQALMLGDNAEADERQPLTYGLKAHLLARSDQHSRYVRWMNEKSSPAALTRKLDAVFAGTDSIFGEFALTLFVAVERLHQALVRNGVKDVFFLAREGQFLKELFDSYQGNRNFSGPLKIHTHYLLASRRAVFLPSLRPLSEETFESLFGQYPNISPKEFLLSLGLSELVEDLRIDYPAIDFDKREPDLRHSNMFEAMLSSPRFREAYEHGVLASREALLRYLASFNRADPDATDLVLVDVGWKGSIQDGIHTATGRKVSGFYVGLNHAGRAAHDNTKEAVLFSSLDGGTPFFHTFNENRSLYEIFLAADHGSAKRYTLRPDGSPRVELDDFVEEQLFKQNLILVQRSHRRLFAAIDSLLLGSKYDSEWLLSAAARHHRRMVFRPSRKELEWISKIFHLENFGVFEQSTFSSGEKRQSIVSRMRFLLSLARGRRNHLGFWPWLTITLRAGRLWGNLYRLYRTHR